MVRMRGSYLNYNIYLCVLSSFLMVVSCQLIVISGLRGSFLLKEARIGQPLETDG